MMKTLRIFNRPILNFFDLYNEFSPAELFSQIDSFIEFAEVHCLPLQNKINDKNGGVYIAKHLTKNFWLEILKRKEWSSEKLKTEEIFREISKEFKDSQGVKEIEDAQIIKKLKFISENSGQSNKNVILMLAIAELAEIDSTKIDSSQWKLLSNSITEQDNEPQKFNCGDGRITLIAGENIYKYYYYDDENLAEGSTIKTVKIEAKGGTNQFAEVKIELYSETLQRCVQKIRLRHGEYIYCNVADGKIIKFLPNISINSEHCLVRVNYAKSDITVFTKGVEEWTVRAEDTSSFAVGVGCDGFILIQNGKINYSFYEPARDHFMRTNLDVIPNSVVEVLLTDDGYKFLLSNGRIRSNYEQSKNNKVSLSAVGRYPLPEVMGVQYKEAAISEGSAAIITGNKEKRFYVQFAGETNGRLIINGKKISLINGGE